jgi:ceramide glucosyltransferase
MVEQEDPLLHGPHGQVTNLGPNPKIRNISRGYREAKGDIIWIIDCNVWVGPGVVGRMVDKLLGLRPNGGKAKPYKFVHQLPLVVDVASNAPAIQERESLLPRGSASTWLAQTTPSTTFNFIKQHGGGRLDEMFMATTHAKFYSAINTVAVAPCIVGKSNMFRKSHLDKLTDPAQNPIIPSNKQLPTGIDYFSSNICEDHLIGDLLWRSNLPGFLNHGLVLGDLAIQPMADMSIPAYAGRRARWLRARKWTVIIATLVEPGVESLLCCAYFAFGITTIPWFNQELHISQTWTMMALVWTIAVTIWMIGDRFVFQRLHDGSTVEIGDSTPAFARGTRAREGMIQRPLIEWIPAWIGREVLALPIWTWAVLLGTTVSWRGKTFRVRMDMSVVEIGAQASPTSPPGIIRTPESECGGARNKDRQD